MSVNSAKEGLNGYKKVNERKKEAVEMLNKYISLFNENAVFTFPAGYEIDIGAFFILTDEAKTQKERIKKFKSIILEDNHWEITPKLLRNATILKELS